VAEFNLDFDDFATVFPDFASRFTETQIRSKLKVVKLLYCGLFAAEDGDTCQEELRQELIYLALAHLLTLESNPRLAIGGKIKTIRNRQDSITFAVNDSNEIYSLSNTMYGQVLQQKIDLMAAGGFVAWAQDLGILQENDLDYI
jgi:hypothetical protein